MIKYSIIFLCIIMIGILSFSIIHSQSDDSNDLKNIKENIKNEHGIDALQNKSIPFDNKNITLTYSIGNATHGGYGPESGHKVRSIKYDNGNITMEISMKANVDLTVFIPQEIMKSKLKVLVDKQIIGIKKCLILGSDNNETGITIEVDKNAQLESKEENHNIIINNSSKINVSCD